MRITVVNLQDNRAVFRIFIALLRFSFDDLYRYPSQLPIFCYLRIALHC